MTFQVFAVYIPPLCGLCRPATKRMTMDDDIFASMGVKDTRKRLRLDDKYTRRIKAPIYEIHGRMPSVHELFGDAKRRQLESDIAASTLSDEQKRFLSLAAHRHVVFDYGAIAEYYAHASPEMQRLMEASALVIVDTDTAIENGYMKLIQDLDNLSQEELAAQDAKEGSET